VIIVGGEKGRTAMRAGASRTFETGIRIGLFVDGNPEPDADEGYGLLVRRPRT
jgi:hypothetical protein